MASHGMPRGSGLRPTTEIDRQKEWQRIKDYNKLVELVDIKIREKRGAGEILEAISKLLKQNPEYYTIWNHRRIVFRQLVDEDRADEDRADSKLEEDLRDKIETGLIKSELDFLVPLLLKFPKCYWIWNYRLWLLQQAADDCTHRYSIPIWEDDLGLVGKMLARDSRNFLAWGYRRTVVDGLDDIENMYNGFSSTERTESEFEYTTTMTRLNLSNFSAWHRRSKLIPRLLTEREADDVARRQMLDDELALIQRALYAGETDQSLWFYHQALMCTFDPQYARQSMAPKLSDVERADYVIKEIDKVMEMLDDAEDPKWIYQELISMTLLLKRLAEKRPGQDEDVERWLGELEKLDPLRAGRWRDLRRSLAN